jgi:hypothetical protein
MRIAACGHWPRSELGRRHFASLRASGGCLVGVPPRHSLPQREPQSPAACCARTREPSRAMERRACARAQHPRSAAARQCRLPQRVATRVPAAAAAAAAPAAEPATELFDAHYGIGEGAVLRPCVGPIKVDIIAGKGRAVVAVQAMRPGDVILIDAPLSFIAADPAPDTEALVDEVNALKAAAAGARG